MLDHLGLQIENFPAEEREFLGPLDRDLMLQEIDDPATSHEQRAVIGVRLSLLGDPRPGVGLREDGLPDVVWCKKVPEGEVTLEENTETFTIDKPFYIAKYPLTYIQYCAFLRAEDGYTNSEWWQGLGFKGNKPVKQFNRRDNHPAENVAWFEAVAFCCWLSKKLGYEIRLPTEWEWQQAATGGVPDNKYPCGSEWDSSRANTYESELSCSTAVGIYPQGASPVGALDMAGNVFGWCLNDYDNPSETKLSGDGKRVVRGGAWANDWAFARVACRFPFPPTTRVIGIGLRLACAAPPPWTADHWRSC